MSQLKRSQRIVVLSVISLVMLGLVALPAPVDAYSGVSHDIIIIQAILVLHNDGYHRVADEMARWISEIIYGSHEADETNIASGEKAHSHHPFTHEGVKDISAAEYCNRYFQTAKSFYYQGKFLMAFVNFGKALHLVQDLTIPHHARLESDSCHSAYEAWLALTMKDETESVTQNGIYSFRSLPNHYNDDEPGGWVDYNAHYSYNFFDLVSTVDFKNWDRAADYLVPRAVRTSAGFMKFFYDEVHSGGIIIVP